MEKVFKAALLLGLIKGKEDEYFSIINCIPVSIGGPYEKVLLDQLMKNYNPQNRQVLVMIRIIIFF